MLDNYKNYTSYIYDVVRLDSEGLDCLYKDWIIQNFGVYGFNALHVHKLIESCGVVDGRQLYVLVDREIKERIMKEKYD